MDFCWDFDVDGFVPPCDIHGECAEGVQASMQLEESYGNSWVLGLTPDDLDDHPEGLPGNEAFCE